ncbi:MAG: hypothetical protein ACR2LI_08905 [Propionibacteriaceae bacterium]
MLFVGDDASSPQIAASLLRRLSGDRVEVTTAGAQLADPGGRPDEMLVAMGLDPADEVRLNAGALRTADRVVILGTSLDVARLPGPRYDEWDVINDDLVERVRALSDDLVDVSTIPARVTARQRLRAMFAAARG